MVRAYEAAMREMRTPELTRTLDQWQAYLGALAKGFDAEDEALIDSLVRPGHPSTPGYNDPNYPLTGRPKMGSDPI